MPRSPLIAAVLLMLAGCGGASAKDPVFNETFFEDAGMTDGGIADLYELSYPALDLKPKDAKGVDYQGVTVLGDIAHLSRPTEWQIRRGKHTKERTYIEYVSPHGYLFAIYKLADKPGDSWKDIEGRYEESAKQKGVEFLESHVPVAMGKVQGREYVLHRSVKGQRSVYTNTCREMIMRGEKHVVLVQVTHKGDTTMALEGDLLHVMESLEVL